MREYIVVNASTLRHLESLVSGRAAEGWRPLGGVSISASWDEKWTIGDYEKSRQGTTLYAQAMTRTAGIGAMPRFASVAAYTAISTVAWASFFPWPKACAIGCVCGLFAGLLYAIFQEVRQS